MGGVSWSTVKTGFMRVNGWMTIDKGGGWRGIVMEIGMRDNLLRERLMARGFTIGQMGRCMMGSGRMGLRRGMVCGGVFLEILIWGSGGLVRLMDMGCISGRMGISLRVVGLIVLSMERARIYLLMEINILEIMLLESQRGKGFINGKIKVFIKRSLRKDINMDMENGRKYKILLKEIDLKDIINMIKRMDKEHLLGKVVTYIMVIM